MENVVLEPKVHILTLLNIKIFRKNVKYMPKMDYEDKMVTFFIEGIYVKVNFVFD